MANCYKPADVVKNCDGADLQALSGGLLIDLAAFKATKSGSLKFTLANIAVVDPTTGLYPSLTGANEVASLTISAAASTTGDVVITLGGIVTNVAIVAADTAIVVAGKIRAAAFTGFVTSGTGANVVFTASAVGAKDDAVYSAGSTGATGAMTTTTQGFSVLSEYYPVKVEWEKNAVKPNYEVIASEVKRDTYAHIASGIIINDSESNAGKETAMALSTRKWVFVYKASGVANDADAYHVLGSKNGLQFVVEPTSDDLGGRVSGSLRSLTGGGESNPNGMNFLLAGGVAATDTLFKNRFNTVAV